MKFTFYTYLTIIGCAHKRLYATTTAPEFIHNSEASTSSNLRGLAKTTATTTASNNDRGLIIHGTDAERGRYPWMVHYSFSVMLCGGSLIAPDLVLTAAHCYASEAETLGVAEISRYDLDVSVQRDGDASSRSVVERIAHPKYIRRTPTNDIAILKLDRPVTDVEPVKLNFDGDFPPEDPDVIQELAMIGWGSTQSLPLVKSDTLQEAHTQYVPFAKCAVATDPTNNVRYGYNQRQTLVRDNWLCTMSQDAFHCKGDSGGPIFVPSNSEGGKDTLVGVITNVVGGCENEYLPQIAQRVSHHIPWILEVGCQHSIEPPSEWNCPVTSDNEEDTERINIESTQFFVHQQGEESSNTDGEDNAASSRTNEPSYSPSYAPSNTPSDAPSDGPSDSPSDAPSDAPTVVASAVASSP